MSPRRMQAGQNLLANVRLENAGTVPLYKDGPGRTLIAQRWQSREGAPVRAPDLRTPLPIDLAAGHAVTIAVGVAPPIHPGAYLLSLLLVQEQVRWLEQDMLTIPVIVGRDAPETVPEGWNVLPDPPPDYDTDHARAFEIMREWLVAHAPPQPRLLEVGGQCRTDLRSIGQPVRGHVGQRRRGPPRIAGRAARRGQGKVVGPVPVRRRVRLALRRRLFRRDRHLRLAASLPRPGGLAGQSGP